MSVRERSNLLPLNIKKIMDITTIDNYIEELEGQECTFSNIRNLASLYTVKEHLESVKNETEAELNDILPQYRIYIEVKRKYQMGELSESEICRSLQALCAEIYEFIVTLYNNTDSETERNCLNQMVKNIFRKF